MSTPVYRKDFMISIGGLVQNATINEALMFNAFRILSGCQTPMARAIFYTLDSFPGKRTLLNRVCDEVGDEEDKKLIRAIIDAAKKSNKQRREVAHTLVLHESQDQSRPLPQDLSDPVHIFTPKSHGEPKLVTREWLVHVGDHSDEALREGQQAYEKLCRKHGVPAKLDL